MTIRPTSDAKGPLLLVDLKRHLFVAQGWPSILVLGIVLVVIWS
jgi:hypothetical protein